MHRQGLAVHAVRHIGVVMATVTAVGRILVALRDDAQLHRHCYPTPAQLRTCIFSITLAAQYKVREFVTLSLGHSLQ